MIESEFTPIFKGPKRQHILPKFYLEGFTRDGYVAVYDRKNKEMRTQPPINTCVDNNFYTFKDSEGHNRYDLEKLLSEYEYKASLVIKKLAAKQEINAEERANISIFIGFAICRTPDAVDSIKLLNSNILGSLTKRIFNKIDFAKEHIRKSPNAPSTEDELEEQAQKLVDFVKNNELNVETDHSWAVGTAMQMSLKIAPFLSCRNWTVIHRDNDKRSFITTDAPVLLTTTTRRESSLYGVGFANLDALVLFPLSQSCALAMSGNEGDFEHKKANGENIRRINLAIGEQCKRFVIGRDEALIRSIADRLNLADREWKPKMQMK
jgi:hypothetical protein